jgi:hypothetical protein
MKTIQESRTISTKEMNGCNICARRQSSSSQRCYLIASLELGSVSSSVLSHSSLLTLYLPSPVDVAEVLYLLFISDNSLLRSEKNTSHRQESVVAFGFFANEIDSDRAMELLTSTSWEVQTSTPAKKEELLQRRNEIIGLLGLQIAAKTKTASIASSHATAKKKDELDSYEALVREAGM